MTDTSSNTTSDGKTKGSFQLSKKTALLALGSNLGDRSKNLCAGLKKIQAHCGTIQAVSSIFETHPLTVPNVEQGPFYNLAVSLTTALSPQALMKLLLKIETEVGREREKEIHWGPRVLDIDIITFGDYISQSGSPLVPHPRYHQRDFVLLPLKEIAPDFRDPATSRSVETMLEELAGEERTAYRRLPLSNELLDSIMPELQQEEDSPRYSKVI